MSQMYSLPGLAAAPHVAVDSACRGGRVSVGRCRWSDPRSVTYLGFRGGLSSGGAAAGVDQVGLFEQSLLVSSVVPGGRGQEGGLASVRVA